ncbi:MAG TPA: hypothetical protein VJJ52_03410 [Candidatus Nanoarchaeia archaeon]|nr:hypothetical protein [Candidatus Nanoarchaeia archaeon]
MKEKIKQLLKGATDGLTLSQIKGLLGDEITLPVLRQSITEMENEKTVASFPGEPDKIGRPQNLYMLIEGDNIVNIQDKEYEYGEERKLLIELLKDITDKYSTLPPEKLMEIYGETAIRLTKENPIDLFLRYADWLKKTHEEEIAKHEAARLANSKDDMTLRYGFINQLEASALVMFNHLLGVPFSLPDGKDWKAGPFRLKYDFKNHKLNSNMDRKMLEEYLKMSVFGEYVLEILECEKLNLPAVIGGSDASLQALDLSRILPWNVEKREMHLVTAVGTRYNIFESTKSDVDWYPEPKVLAEYERKKAISEGYLIPPEEALGQDSNMYNRIKEAAMSLRQYHKDHEIMFEKEPLAKLHFRDGRIFPVEHRFYDSIQPGLHGDIVRMALNQFNNIVNQIGVSDGRIKYCGFVKRPGIAFIAPIIRWYMGFGSANNGNPSIDPGMDIEEYLKFPNSDSFTTAFLFKALREKTKTTGCIVTFRTLRRFQYLQEPFIINQPPTNDPSTWRKSFMDKYSDVNPYIDETGLDTYANLLARAAVISFYTSLDSKYDPRYEPSTVIPRVEMMVPFMDIGSFPSPGGIITKERKYVCDLLSVMFHEGVLDKYNEQLFFMKKDNPAIFLVPKTVRDAHLASKMIAKVFKDDFLNLLVREARIFWLEKKYKKAH